MYGQRNTAVWPPLGQAASAVSNSASSSVQANYNYHTEPTTTPQQKTSTGLPPPYRPPRHRSPASRANLPAPAPGPPYLGPVPFPGYAYGFPNPAPGYCNYPSYFSPAGFGPPYFPPCAVPVDPTMVNVMQRDYVRGQRYPNKQYSLAFQRPADNWPWDSEGFYRNQQWIIQHADPLHLRTHPEITRLLDNMLKRQLSSMENPLKHNDSVLEHLAAGGAASYQALIKFLRTQVPRGKFQSVADELETALGASVSRSVTAQELQLSDLPIRQDQMEVKMSNGIIVWRISDVRRRLAEAESEHTPSLYSSPFYTSPAGYKMCARIYLNGDGSGKNTHISLFFVVMRGDFDALLPWPFQRRVKLSLMDQSPAGVSQQRHDTVEVFRPDVNSSSFQKPTSDMNIATGCPRFAPKELLHSSRYMRDDTIFLKVDVNMSGVKGADWATMTTLG